VWFNQEAAMALRTIQVSTSVFARIWACRETGEESEDAILDRLIPGSKGDELDSLRPESTPGGGGHTERRYGVHFPGGFAISRNYLGQQYGANAVSDGWVLANDGKTYHSLNELSHAVGAKTENAWRNWFYVNDKGLSAPIADLRDPDKVKRRNRGPVDAGALLAVLGIKDIKE
jgi:hypothetical protein